MYHLFGFEENVKNVCRLAATTQQLNKVRNLEDLKPIYQKFLSLHHPSFPIGKNRETVVTNPQLATQFTEAFSESSLNDLQQEQMVGQLFAEHSLQQKSLRIENALRKISLQDRSLSELLRLCIHAILVSDSRASRAGLKAHGGTSSQCIGLMWLVTKENTSQQDLMEMLVHELTHTLVFIDERNHRHFDYEKMTKKENWAQSAILHRPRPMDKVVHSIVVASEIILFREANNMTAESSYSIHPPTPQLRESLGQAIDSVLNLKTLHQVCHPRSVFLVEEAKRKVITPMTEQRRAQ